MGTSTDPVYLRVLEDLRGRIRAGLLEPGARVPSRNAIMTRYGVGETAAKHALQVLGAEGLIEARAGSGSYVRKTVTARYLAHDRLHFPGSPFGLAGPPDCAARRTSWEHQTQAAVPPAHIARRFGLAPGVAVTATRYLLTSDGEPVQLAVSYEPPGLAEGTAAALAGERAVEAADIVIPADRFRLRYRFGPGQPS
jgi:GntR family transcriptional regulator